MILEAQFSNYPFLINNVARTDFFFRTQTAFADEQVQALVVIAKAHQFPAAQSTLYFEQAQNQLGDLCGADVFKLPIRLVGLFSPTERAVPAVLTRWGNARYSRTVAARLEVPCILTTPVGRGRSQIREV